MLLDLHPSLSQFPDAIFTRALGSQRCDHPRLFIHFAFSAGYRLRFAIVPLANVASHFLHGGAQLRFTGEPLTILGRPAKRRDLGTVKVTVDALFRSHESSYIGRSQSTPSASRARHPAAPSAPRTRRA